MKPVLHSCGTMGSFSQGFRREGYSISLQTVFTFKFDVLWSWMHTHRSLSSDCKEYVFTHKYKMLWIINWNYRKLPLKDHQSKIS
jgi:hypothetical protein